MQSSGSTSSQPSQDSLSSNDSFLFSDVEHSGDDSSVFLSESESGGGRAGGALYSLDRGSASSPSSQWALDGFGDQDQTSLLQSAREERCPSNVSYSALVSSSSGAKAEKEREGGGVAQTEGDHLFAQKCAELQGFIRPLLELLNGLKKGRFDRGLSTFQQSVAMDRIQRIVGVLQKPTIGGKYLQTLLQVEMMLKLWFPQISPCAPSTSEHSVPPHSTPPHKHRDQLHIPVKKRRLSWSDTDSLTPPPLRCKRFDRGGQDGGCRGGREQGCGAAPAAVSRAEREGGAVGYGRRAAESPADAADRETPDCRAVHWSELSTTWVHVTPILSPPKSCSSHSRGATKAGFTARPVSPPSASCSPATQDSSISSTTPFSNPHHLLLRQCQPVACQSQPVATETEDFEGGASKTRQGRSQSLPPALKPVIGAEGVTMHSPTQT